MTAKQAVPRHVAVIMDGNGRWATLRRKPRIFGHHAGRGSVEKIIRAAAEAGVQTLSLFAFSTENWVRPKKEVRLIMELIRRSIAEETERLDREGIRIRFIGSREALSPALCEKLDWAAAMTAGNTRMDVVFALDYSGRWAILETAKKLAAQAVQGQMTPQSIDEAAFQSARPMPDLPPVDLLIRSSGELRLSNFHLWEMAYAELYFTDILWPDFDEAAFDKALACYRLRERRYGGVDYPHEEEKC